MGSLPLRQVEWDRQRHLFDSRVGRLAIDVSLTAKTSGSAQIQGFFRSDFQPEAVIIIRPSQLGPNHTYLIPRPKGL
jgi:hypothetical protein